MDDRRRAVTVTDVLTRPLRPLAGVALALGLVAGVTPAGASAPSPAPSQLRIQQALGELGYLPLAFTPTAGASASPQVQSGTWSWRFAVPPVVRARWRLGAGNVLETGAIMTFDRVHGLPVEARPTRAMETALLSDAGRGRRDPEPWNEVYVSMAQPERLYLYVNGRVTETTLVNTGVSASPTAPGTFPVYLRYTSQTMSGTYPWGGSYSDPGIPWVSYFDGGDALHGFIRASYGFPQSLGCVEMPFAAARALWPHTPIGTLVTVATARP